MAERGAPRVLMAELVGGDAHGRGDRPVLSWWLPTGASRQVAYRITTSAGFDTGRVESDSQSFVGVDPPGSARVQVWTDLGESAWSTPVVLAGAAPQWVVPWVGVHEPVRAPKGLRPAYWLRSVIEVHPGVQTRAHVTALGLYALYVNGTRVGDDELAPGFTEYGERVQAQTHDVTSLLRGGPNVVAVLLADGWYRGQVGMPRAADQWGETTAVRVQLESLGVRGWVAVDQDWRTSPSHITAADLIGGQREDRRLVDAAVHDPGYDESAWQQAVAREVEVAIVAPVAPPVRRTEEVRPVSVTELQGAFVVDLGQNINGWVRLSDLGPEGTRITLRHGEHLDAGGDLTTAHLDVNVPIFPEPLPVGQVDEVISAGRPGDVFEPRFSTHGFRYVRIEGHPGPLGLDDMTGVVVHSDLRRTGWFSCSDERVNRLHEAAVWSLRGNMCAIPTDCPQRERAGWTGDWQVFAPTAAYLYDVLGFTRSWLRDVALGQRADGCVANMAPCPPAEGFDGPVGGLNGSAGWGDVVVSAPWDLYQAYGDVSLLRESWDSLRQWVDFAAGAAAAGRHLSREGQTPAPYEKFLWDEGFHWGEWLEPDFAITDFGAFVMADKSEVATAYLHRSAATAVRIGELIGADAATVGRFREIADGARAAWQAEFVRADGSLAVQTQASHVRALAFGLVPDALRPAVASRLDELVAEAGGHLSTGFLSTGLLLPALADAGTSRPLMPCCCRTVSRPG